MNSVVSLSTGVSKRLDGSQQPDEVVTTDDAADSTKLARLLTRVLKDLAALKRQYLPRTITFRDIVTTGSSSTPQVLSLTHGFNAPVEWSLVRIAATSNVTPYTVIERFDTTATTLVLLVYFSATVSVRVQEAA